MLKLIPSRLVVHLAAAALALAGTVVAQADLVKNGDFKQFTNGKNGVVSELAPLGSTNTNYSTLTNWSYKTANSGYTFVFTSNGNKTTADTTGCWTETNKYYFRVWGANDGGPNTITLAPDGGNFLASDGAYRTDAIQQTIAGLTKNNKYDLSFYYAAAQEGNGLTSTGGNHGGGQSGVTTDYWKVSLGGQTLNTPTITDPSHGFSGWSKETMTFTYDGSTPILSFLAVGSPNGTPPMILLSGVTMNATAAPVPPSALIAITGLVLVIGSSKLRNRKAAKRTKLAL